MYNLIVISHGNLAEYLVKTSEMILGKQEGLEYLCLQANESKDSFDKRLEEKLNELVGGDVLVLADLYGGTPFNSTITNVLKGGQNINLLTGVNLPMLIQALLNKEKEISKEVLDEIKTAAIEGIQDAIEILNSNDEE